MCIKIYQKLMYQKLNKNCNYIDGVNTLLCNHFQCSYIGENFSFKIAILKDIMKHFQSVIHYLQQTRFEMVIRSIQSQIKIPLSESITLPVKHLK